MMISMQYYINLNLVVLYKLFQNEFNEFHTVELHDGYIKNDFTIYIKKREFFN